MIRKPATLINQDLCTGCGLCITVCPSDTISMVDKKAKVTGNDSMHCGHCAAICPEDAISVTSLSDEYVMFNSFKADLSWLPYGKPDSASLFKLMASRRSCRNYKSKEVSRDILEDLVKLGTTAPSGTNSQKWTFLIIPNRESLESYSNNIMDFFKNLNNKAEKRWLRSLLRMFGKTQLNDYYLNYYEPVKESIKEWETNGVDRLFHGATAAILVGAEKGASCPSEDALLATQNILLGAHSLGLGSCLIGFAVEAMKQDPVIKTKIGIPSGEKIYSVIALGRPKEAYKKISGRKKVVPRYYTT